MKSLVQVCCISVLCFLCRIKAHGINKNQRIRSSLVITELRLIKAEKEGKLRTEKEYVVVSAKNAKVR